MSKKCDLYLDKGSDFYTYVCIRGINYEPLDISDFEFCCNAEFVYDRNLKKQIECLVESAEEGLLLLHLPYFETEDMPPGMWHYNIEATFHKTRRLRLLEGHIKVSEDFTNNCF